MKITDFGVLQGDVLLFGGPYSNRQALEALIAEAERQGIGAGNAISTGDVVAYCGDAQGTIAGFRAWGPAGIAGNCEKQLAAGAADCGCGFEAGTTCDLLSAGWYGHAKLAIDAEARIWMGDLPDLAVFSHAGRRYGVIHGGLTDTARFLWPVSPEAAFLEEIAAIEAAIGPVDGVIAGHSGIAFERMIGSKVWINAGVIGMPPHDGRPETRYVILREDGARIMRLSYDVAAARADMEAAGLVQGYDQALEGGLWPSEDVLPGAMRR